jgi:hypothetical protein
LRAPCQYAANVMLRRSLPLRRSISVALKLRSSCHRPKEFDRNAARKAPELP